MTEYFAEVESYSWGWKPNCKGRYTPDVVASERKKRGELSSIAEGMRERGPRNYFGKKCPLGFAIQNGWNFGEKREISHKKGSLFKVIVNYRLYPAGKPCRPLLRGGPVKKVESLENTELKRLTDGRIKQSPKKTKSIGGTGGLYLKQTKEKKQRPYSLVVQKHGNRRHRRTYPSGGEKLVTDSVRR